MDRPEERLKTLIPFCRLFQRRGDSSLDLLIMAILLAASGVLIIAPFPLGRKKALGLFPFMGAILALNSFLSLVSDGSVTQTTTCDITTCTGTSQVLTLVSPALSSSTWNDLLLLVVFMMLIGFLLTIYVGLKGN